MVPNRRRPSVATFCVLLILTGLLAGCSQDPAKAKLDYLNSGKQYMAKKEYSAAAIEFRNALKIDPKYVDALYELAKADEAMHLWSETYKTLRQAKEIDPNRLDIRIALGQFYASGKNFSAAEDEANFILQKEPNNAAATQILASAYLGQKEYPKALEASQRLVKLLPNRASSYDNLALAELTMQKVAEAESNFQKAIQVEPDFVPAYKNLASFYRLQGKLAKAEEVLQRGVAQNPFATPLYLDWAGLLAAEGKSDAVAKVITNLRQHQLKSADVALAIGDFYVKERNPDAALAEYHRGLSLDPKQKEIKYHLVALLLDLGKVQDAVPLDKEILKQNPTSVDGRIAQARILMAQQDAGKARTILQQVVKDAPDSAQGHYFLGAAFQGEGKFQQARQEMERALGLSSNMPLVLHGLTMVSLNLGDLHLAEAYAQRSVNAQPANPSERMLLSSILLREAKTSEALKQLGIVEKQDPQNIQLHIMLAQAYTMGRHYSDADKEFSKATSIDPKSTQVLSAWADSLISRGERAKAFSLAKSYVAKYPADPNGYLVLGSLELEAKQYDAAQANLEETLKLDPKNMAAYLRLGKVFQDQGNIPEAIVHYKGALAERPKFVPLITFIGNLYLVDNNLETAKSYYEKALAIDPNFPIASANLAWVYAQQGTNLNVALSLAQSAGDKLGRVTSITDTLAWVQYKKGLYSSAVSLLDGCVKQEPKSPVYHYHLGLALLKSGDKKRAKLSLQEALRLNLSGDDATDARQVLAKLN